MVQQSQFKGKVTEDPNSDLAMFIEICDTIKMNSVSEDTIRLSLFPFSLRDTATFWLNSHPPNTFTSWKDLSHSFLNKYFPPAKTAKLRMDITNQRGCSSHDRALALHARGTGFDTPHLQYFLIFLTKKKGYN